MDGSTTGRATGPLPPGSSAGGNQRKREELMTPVAIRRLAAVVKMVRHGELILSRVSAADLMEVRAWVRAVELAQAGPHSGADEIARRLITEGYKF